MARTAVTPSPGFISIAVNDVERSAAFYAEFLGAVRDTFDWGPGSAVFVGWPTVALSGIRRPGQPGPSPRPRASRSGGGQAIRRSSTNQRSKPASRS